MMTRRELEDRIRGIRWLGPPPGLRERTLSAALLAPSRLTWSDRIWFSRGWRLSAATAAVALVGLSVWSGRIGSHRALVPLPAPADLAIESVIRDAGFPEDVARAVTRRSRAAAFPAAMDQVRAVLETIDGGN